MKKLSVIALLIGLFVIGTVNVKALTEAELKDKVLKVIEVDGEKYGLTSAHKKLVETYFAENNISDKDATYIGEKFDEAVSITKKQGNVSFSKFPESVKQDLKGLVTDISKNTDVKATLTKDGLVVQNADGSEFVITGLVKQTGYETSKTAIIVAISFIIVAVGTGFVIKQVKTSE